MKDYVYSPRIVIARLFIQKDLCLLEIGTDVFDGAEIVNGENEVDSIPPSATLYIVNADGSKVAAGVIMRAIEIGLDLQFRNPGEW